jgi:hypothetical protein
MRGEKQLKIAMMVRGYLPAPRPADMIYAPIDLAVATAEGLVAKGHQVDYYGPLGTRMEHANVVDMNLRPLATDNREIQELFHSGEQMNHYLPSFWDTYLAEEMFRRAQLGEYDVLHFHHPEIALPLARRYRDVPRGHRRIFVFQRSRGLSAIHGPRGARKGRQRSRAGGRGH